MVPQREAGPSLTAQSHMQPHQHQHRAHRPPLSLIAVPLMSPHCPHHQHKPRFRMMRMKRHRIVVRQIMSTAVASGNAKDASSVPVRMRNAASLAMLVSCFPQCYCVGLRSALGATFDRELHVVRTPLAGDSTVKPQILTEACVFVVSTYSLVTSSPTGGLSGSVWC